MRLGGWGHGLALAAVLTAGAPAHAERYAVLAVDGARDGAASALAAAREMRARLKAAGIDVLEEEATRAPLRAHLSRGGAPLASYQGRVAQSEAALAALEQEKAVQILESLVRDLVADQEPSVEKLTLLEQSRLRLANRLIGLGGKKETGQAETEEGQQAHRLLVEALRTRPTLAPSKDEYPARFFVLLEKARHTLELQGQGGLHVDSRPRGATVFLEGRDVGRTPLVLGADALPRGEYRMWLALGPARSVPVRVFVDAAPKPVIVDLAFDGSLWPEGPGLRPVEGASIDEDVAKEVGSLLGAERLILTGTAPGEGGVPSLWGASFSVARAEAARRGAVPLAEGAKVDEAADQLLRYLSGEDFGQARASKLPPGVLPPKEPVAAGEGEIPWTPIGIVAGSVAGVLLVGGAVVAAVVFWPRNGAYTVTVTDMEGQ